MNNRGAIFAEIRRHPIFLLFDPGELPATRTVINQC